MYINTQTLQRVSEQQIRAEFPNVSFPKPFKAPGGYAVLFATPQPTFDIITEFARETTPVEIDSKWYQAWEVVALDAEQVALNQAKAKEALVQQYDAALAKHLDTVAQSKRYDDRITCAVRAGYPGPFQAEGQAFAAWMDTCNATAYQWWAEIEAGTRPMFESTQDFIDQLPAIQW